MSNPYSNQYQQNMGNMPPIQTQNHGPPPHHMQHQQPPPQQQPPHQPPHQPVSRPFSPPSYQHSPGPMSPNVGGMPVAKRQRMSPHPQSPYTSPFNASPYGPVASPYSATSPPAGPYHPPPHPAPYQTQSSFNQPQPYQHPQHNVPVETRPPPQISMPPPKVPASKTQDSELEKANARDMDVNNISDVLTGSGIDLRAEEEYLTHSFGARNQDTSFYSQGTASTISPHGSFNNWGQAGQHGAFRGTGPLSQKPVTDEEQEAELLRKYEAAARAHAESAQQPLSDPFLLAGNIRHKIATCAYQNGIHVNLEGVFDKIPDAPQNVRRTKVSGPNGELVVALQADSLLNHNAPFVELLSLISLAAEERCRTVLEDAFALAQNRQNTADGVVPPDLADIVAVTGGAPKATTTVPKNLSKTPWEAPDSAASPATTTNKNSGRLPTPPTEAPPTPQPTISVPNPVAAALRKRVLDDYNYEKQRVAKRQKRLQGSSAAADATPLAPLIPEKMSKKERDRLNKAGQSDEHVHRRANETASLALGGKKKYSWMMGGGGGGGGMGSGASTPRISAATGAASGTATPAQPTVDRALLGARRTYGAPLDAGDTGRKIQLRDVIHVLDVDGRHRKTLATLLARPKGTEMDEKEKRAATAR